MPRKKRCDAILHIAVILGPSNKENIQYRHKVFFGITFSGFNWEKKLRTAFVK